MSKQIAVRLPDDLVAFLDRLVREGQANSRAAVVARALNRERRREAATRDAAILARTSTGDPDLDSLAEYVAHIPLNLD
ncbi:MAG: ribbon-helix-helix domain-containing protein [Mycobacteriales bacterium]